MPGLWILKCAIAHHSSRFARPGMTRNLRFRSARQQAFLDRLDLQRQILRIDPALREAACDEPQAGLTGARIHIAQFLFLAESPDRADTRCDLVAKQPANQKLPGLV